MSKKRQWSWLTRLEHLPQRAERRFTTQFHRIPQRVRFFIFVSLLSALTTLLVSNFPISTMPSYHVGEVAEHDVVAPVELIVKDDVGNDDLAEQIKRNPVLLRAGETVTAEKLPLIERVRQYQLAERQPKRLIGLLALVGMMFFALYKSAVTSQSSRLGPRTAFWVASSALMFQTLLARVGMFGASVVSARPETGGLGGVFELQFAIPFAPRAPALSLLVGAPVPLGAALMSALLVGFISPHDLAISAFAFAGSVVAIYSVQRYRTRNAVIVAGAAVAVVNAGMGVASSLIADNDWNWKSILGGVAFGMIGAALTAGVASFAIPIYESAFDILTDLKLLELSNADNPLLRQTAIRPPGTRHHSVIDWGPPEKADKAIGRKAPLGPTPLPLSRHRQAGRAEHVHRKSEGRAEPARQGLAARQRPHHHRPREAGNS